MIPGAITQDIDVPQIALAGFALFFAGLVYHLRREDKREGYPLEDPAGGRRLIGFPEMPGPKTFALMEGGTTTAPHHEGPAELQARPLHPAPGSPLVPLADPLRSAIGPAAYPLRKPEPLMYLPGKVQVLPMRELEEWHVVEGDADPRGMPVVAADGGVAGTACDLWIDRSAKILRYIELELAPAVGEGHVILPIYYAQVHRRRRQIRVKALRARQFALVPRLHEPNRITAREEDQVTAFYAGGAFYGETMDWGRRS